ncbi:hypothetical protein GT755_32815 [Herbidospora sp. NEAU-GS84]|uniref:Chaplin n=1 Tax=Herbidospora solisilvae TaxID=2696284 RepID=A0A7C9JJ90_9ACTN|nr:MULTISPECIES: hypothetical protein [Herbidospora]NAS26443.1 hypothetical protein [Herbidospora solisilvae]GLX98588.1 hypothetical protein Hesp01_65380 [Herbidospora sp. NBRC 101105]
MIRRIVVTSAAAGLVVVAPASMAHADTPVTNLVNTQCVSSPEYLTGLPVLATLLAPVCGLVKSLPGVVGQVVGGATQGLPVPSVPSVPGVGTVTGLLPVSAVSVR